MPNSSLADGTCATKTGQSQICDFDQIQVKTDILINGQPTDFVRASAAAGSSFKFEVKVTLVSPASLTLPGRNGVGLINQGTQVNASGTLMSLNGFGAVAYPSLPGSSACKGIPIPNSLLLPTCDNPPFNAPQEKNIITATTFKTGDTLFDYIFTANATDYAKLGLNLSSLNDDTSSTTGINLVYIRPTMRIAFNSLTGFLSPCYSSALTGGCYPDFTGAGIGFYIQLYQNQDQVNTANAAGPPPACAPNQNPVAGQPINCVPGYGGTSGSTMNPVNDNSGGIMALISSIITGIASLVNQLIYFIFYWLVAPIIQAILSIHVYSDTFVNVIYPGWEIVRNVCNILFIVAIIAMGMATLLRVESYQWRHLLVQLVIAALLVNFSLIIAQAILAIADTIQSQFLPNNVDVIRSLARDLMIANNSVTLSQNSLAGNVSYVIQYLFFVAMAIGSFLVFSAIAVFLVIRVAMIWVLLMLSPIAYVARILPATESAAKTWWDNFIKYAFFTPVIAFFLNMTAVISAATLKTPVLQQLTDGSAFKGSNSPNLSAFVLSVASNILLLVFLIIAIKVADYMGVAGGKALSEIGEKGLRLPFNIAGKVASKPVGAVANIPKNLNERYGFTDRAKNYAATKKAAVGNAVIGDGKNPLRQFAYNTMYGQQIRQASKAARDKKFGNEQALRDAKVKDNFATQKGLPAHNYQHEVDHQAAEVQKHFSYADGNEFKDGLKTALEGKGMSKEEKMIQTKAHMDEAAAKGQLQDAMDTMAAYKQAKGERATDKYKPVAEGGYVEFLNDFQKETGMNHHQMESIVRKNSAAARTQKKLQFITDASDYTDVEKNETAQKKVMSRMSTAEKAQIDDGAFFERNDRGVVTQVSNLAVEYAKNASDEDAKEANKHMAKQTRAEFKARTSTGWISSTMSPAVGGTPDYDAVGDPAFTTTLK